MTCKENVNSQYVNVFCSTAEDRDNFIVTD